MFKDIIDSKNISCYRLAKESGLSYTTINEIYRGERSLDECSIETGKKLSSFFNMSLDELCEESDKRISIPDNLYKCFWDTDYTKLDLIKDRTYIITRLLSKGGYDGLVFIKRAYTYEEIKEVAMTSRNLSPKVASFLKNVFHLKENQMVFYLLNVKDWRK